MGKTEPKSPIIYEVDFGKTFNKYYANAYSPKTLDKIDIFIEHYEQFGLRGWQGKVASTDRVPEHYQDREKIIAKAREHNLWHAHIGDPVWKKSLYGDYLVSDWVIHFKRISRDKIKLLELGFHDPMLLPSDEILNEE